MIMWKIDSENSSNNLFFHLLDLFFSLFCLLICVFFFRLLLVMSDPMDHATGIEKRELLARAAGNDDPFDMRVFKRGAGTKDSPNLIPSAFDARLVGCICKLSF